MDRRNILKSFLAGCAAVFVPKKVSSSMFYGRGPYITEELPDKSKIEHCYLSHGDLADQPDDWVFSQTIGGEGDMVVHMKNKAIISLDEYNELLATAGREKVEW